MNIDKVLSTLPSGSWCTRAKATRIAEVIDELKPKVCVEIGVFGGDSFFIIAGALKQLGDGIVYGIDPWDKDAAIEGMGGHGPNHAWWSRLDYEAIYRGAVMKRKTYGLEKYCELIRARSTDDKALLRIEAESIGLFHLDGNHGKKQSLDDAIAWLPKVSPTGCIVVDDVGWTEGGEQTVYVAMEYLLTHGWEIDGMVGDCAFMRRK